MLKKSSDASASKSRSHSSRFHSNASRPSNVRTNSQSANPVQNKEASSSARRRKETTGEDVPPSTEAPPVPPRQPVSRGKLAEHSFLTDVADVKEMETGLLSLLDDFHSGKLQAFGSDEAFKKMDQVRDQQEQLAKMHFKLDHDATADGSVGSNSSTKKGISDENMEELLGRLHALSQSIQDLHPSSASQTATPNVGNEHNGQDGTNAG